MKPRHTLNEAGEHVAGCEGCEFDRIKERVNAHQVASATTAPGELADKLEHASNGFFDQLSKTDCRQAAALLRRCERAMRTRPDYNLRCIGCGSPHNIDTSVPSDVWSKISNGDGILCTLCIDERCAEAGIRAEAEFYFVGDALYGRSYQSSFGEVAELKRRCAAMEAVVKAAERLNEVRIKRGYDFVVHGNYDHTYIKKAQDNAECKLTESLNDLAVLLDRQGGRG